MSRALALSLLVACAGSQGEGGADRAAAPPELGADPLPADPLADERFAFCHEEGADADQLARWCALLDHAPADTCPGMRRTCAEGRFEAAPTGCERFAPPGRSSRFESGAPDDEDPWRRRERQACEGVSCDGGHSDALLAVLQWGAAGLVALLIVGVARLLLARFGWIRVQPAAARPSAAIGGLEAIAGDDDLPLLPEDQLLAEARRALAAGRLGEAVIWARGAALRRLARRGVLRLHRARTDREYLRAARRDGASGELLAAVLRAVEDHRWAGRTLTEGAARAAVDAAARLLAVTILAVLLTPGTASAQRRYAPHGDAALHRVLTAAGWALVRNEGTFDDLEGVEVVVLDRYAVDPTEADWASLRAWVEAGGVLVLGGDPRPAFPELGRSLRFSGHGEDVALAPFAADAGLVAPVWPGGPTYMLCGDVAGVVVLPVGARRTTGPWATPELFYVPDDTGVPDLLAAPPAPGGVPDARDTASTHDTGHPGRRTPVDAVTDLEPVDCVEPALVALTDLGDGALVGLPDPLVLRNAAMVIEANRRLLPELLREGAAAGWWAVGAAPRALVATAPGVPDPTPVDSVANARMLPFVIHLFVWWVLLALHAGWRLSPARDPREPGRVDFAEHAAALGSHWDRLGATRHAAAAFARLELTRLGPKGLAAAALRAGHDAASARALVARVEALATDPDGPDDPSDLTTVEELWSLSRRRPT